MKRLIIWLAILLPLFTNAQTNGTIQKTSATGTIRGSFGSLGLDTLPRVTGALVDGYILKYHAATNKWYASPDGGMVGLSDSLAKKANRTFDNVASGAIANVKLANSTISGVALGSNLNTLTLGNGLTGTSYNGSGAVTARADTAVLQTVLNFFPKGDTRWAKIGDIPTLGTSSISLGGTANGLSYSAGNYRLHKVTATTGGVLTTGQDTIAGAKILTDGLKVRGVLPSTGIARITSIDVENTNEVGLNITDLSPANNSTETAYTMYGIVSNGDKRKRMSMSTIWTDSSSTTGYARARINATYNGGLNDDVSQTWYGNNGIRIFNDIPAGPGANIFAVNGTVSASAFSGGSFSGTSVSGTTGTFGSTLKGNGDVRSNLDGSNSPSAGAFYLLGNTANDRFWLSQLNASNGIDWHYYNGSGFTKYFNIDVSGNATFTGTITLPDEAYSASWNGKLEAPTKNAIYDAGFLTSASGVASITGTANQVIASASTGSVTLSLPQSIATSSTPTFGGLTLTGSLTGTNGFFKSSATASEPFRVKYSGNTNNMLEIFEYASGIRSEVSFRDGSGNAKTRFDTGGNNFINGGNLGVGTTTPSAKLVVSNNDALGYEIDPTAASGTKIQTFAYNRSTAAFKDIENYALSHKFLTGSSALALTLGSSQELITPSLAGSGDVITGANNGGQIGKITVGSGLSLTSGVLTATGGSSGTVTTAGGTAGIISKFTSASNIENSSLTESSGNLFSSGSFTAESGLIRTGRASPSTNGSSYLEMVNSNSVTNWRIATNFNHSGELEFNPSTTGGGSTFTTSPFRLNSSGNLVLAGTIGASNFSGTSSGTNTGDQTTITGNAGTATALQTARNIQGVSFNGTADINPINGTGFVKASGTTLSYDNSTYLTGNQTVTLSGAVTGSGATSISTTLASGIDATKIADGSVTSTEFQYINSLSSNAQDQINAKAGLNSPALTGNPTAPTQTAGDNSTKIATTAYVDAGLALKLNLSGGTLTGGLNGTTATFSGDVTANSDSTLKKNIKPLVSISTALRNIGAYSYDWKSNDAHAIGLIAQEVQKYFPELVKTDDKGILSMNYQNFTAVLLAGWKDLDERITKLEQK